MCVDNLCRSIPIWFGFLVAWLLEPRLGDREMFGVCVECECVMLTNFFLPQCFYFHFHHNVSVLFSEEGEEEGLSAEDARYHRVVRSLFLVWLLASGKHGASYKSVQLWTNGGMYLVSVRMRTETCNMTFV